MPSIQASASTSAPLSTPFGTQRGPRPPPKPSHLATWKSRRGRSPTPSEAAASDFGAEFSSDDEDASDGDDSGPALVRRSMRVDATLRGDGAGAGAGSGREATAKAKVAAPASSIQLNGRTPLKNIWAANGEDASHSVSSSAQNTRAPASRAQEALESRSSSPVASRHSRYASALSTLRGPPRGTQRAAEPGKSQEATGVDVASWLRGAGAERHAGRPPSLVGTLRDKAWPRKDVSETSAGSATPVATLEARSVPGLVDAVAARVALQEAGSSAPSFGDDCLGDTKSAAQSEQTVEGSISQVAPESVKAEGLVDIAEGRPVSAEGLALDEQRSEQVRPFRPESIAMESDEAAVLLPEGERAAAASEAGRPQIEAASKPVDFSHPPEKGTTDLTPSTSTLVAAGPTTEGVEHTTTLSRPPPTQPRFSGRPARALFEFAGEATFNELTLRAGQTFEVLVPELRGGWSLALLRDASTGAEKRGLVPVGWYCYIQEFATSPTSQPAATQQIGSPPKNFALNTIPEPVSEREEAEGGPSSAFTALPGSTLTAAPSFMTRSNSSASTSSTSKRLANAHAAAARSTSMRIQSPIDEDEMRRPASGVGVFSSGLGTSPALKALEALHAANTEPQSQAESSGSTIRNRQHGNGRCSPEADSRHGAIHVDVPADMRAESEAAGNAGSEAVEQEGAAQVTNSAMWKGPGGLLGGRRLNRFSPFVTSGVEAFLLSRKRSDPASDSREAEDHYDLDEETTALEGLAPRPQDVQHVTSGTHGPAWKSRARPFHVVVHSPEARWDSRGAAYTAYAVTSLFGDADAAQNEQERASRGEVMWQPYDPALPPETPLESLSVWRRFSQFHWLALYLSRSAPLLSQSLPPVPPKSRAGKTRLEAAFVEERRRALSNWLGRIIRHPVARTDPGVLFFLGCADENEWNARAPRLLRDARSANESANSSGGPKAANFFARTTCDPWGFDAGDAEEAAERLRAFDAAYELGMGEGGGSFGMGIMGAFDRMRQAGKSEGESFRLLSRALSRMSTGAGLGPHGQAAHLTNSDEGAYGPAMGKLGTRGESGATNEDGAWCWRPDCKDCIAGTRAMQSLAAALQDVGDLHDYHAREALLLQHERLRALSRPAAQHAALLDVHGQTLALHREAVGEEGEAGSAERGSEADAMIARCETVLNITMSEMDRIHNERVEDWISVGRNLLDDQITLHEQVLQRLHQARADYQNDALTELQHSGPILHSSQALAELSNPLLDSGAAEPLIQPTAPVLHPGVLSATFRPVSLAGEMIGNLFAPSQGLAEDQSSPRSPVSLVNGHSTNVGTLRGASVSMQHKSLSEGTLRSSKKTTSQSKGWSFW